MAKPVDSPMPNPMPEEEMLNWGRLLLDGLPYADLVAARDRAGGVSWFDHWMTAADRYERLADDALRTGHRRTAAELLLTGALAAQYGQFLWFDDRRQRGQRRKAELYRRAAPLLDPPAHRFDLPIDDTSIPGYLRVPPLPPHATAPQPCVVLIGGLESTKEESFRFEELLLQRGMAVATFDGPGQGEMFPRTPLRGDFERYTSMVVDALVDDPRVDSGRIAVLGRSLGGHYALRSASLDPRLVACVSWGGFVDMDEWDAETPMTKESWRYVSQVDTLDEARAHVRKHLDVRPVLPQLQVPTYVLHGSLDEIPDAELDVLRECAPHAPLDIVVEPLGDHCCHNLGPEPRLRMADWLADRLGTAM
ncbi:alpha/beta hydrolase family protein [Streptomyces sp. BH104]|uniref:alpha/beta hydrolase family protein n=1 Tax=Streptomyces sp. BH104 TaxID=3410407 RepID=UPI003BB6511E